MIHDRSNPVYYPTYAGAAASFIAFLFVGVVPGLLYGSYMGLTMSGILLGHSTDPNIVAKIIIVGGMVLGLLATMFFFVIIGAFFGTLVGFPFHSILKKMGTSEPAAANGSNA